MIGLRPSERVRAFDGVQPAHPIRFRLAARGEIARVAHAGRMGCEQVFIEGDNHAGLVQRQMRPIRQAKGLPRALADVVPADRLVFDPFGFREFLQQTPAQIEHSRRTGRFGQYAHATAICVAIACKGAGRHGCKLAPLGDALLIVIILAPDDFFAAVRIVHFQNCRLGVMVRRALAVRVIGIAFHLDRSAIVAGYQKAGGDTAEFHCRRVLFRLARHVAFRTLVVGGDLFLFPAAARRAGQRQRSAHDLQKMTPREIGRQFRAAYRELARQRLLELRRLRQLVQAAPVTVLGGLRLSTRTLQVRRLLFASVTSFPVSHANVVLSRYPMP